MTTQQECDKCGHEDINWCMSDGCIDHDAENEPVCPECGREGYGMACEKCEECGGWNGTGGGDCKCLCEEDNKELVECDKCGHEDLFARFSAWCIDHDAEEIQCSDCKIEAKKHCDECGGYGSEEEEEEILKCDHSILWITKPNDNEKIIQAQCYYGDDMLEEMFEIIMGGGIQSVGISSRSGSLEEVRTEEIIYSWDIVNGANEDFGVRVDRREGGNW